MVLLLNDFYKNLQVKSKGRTLKRNVVELFAKGLYRLVCILDFYLCHLI